MTTEPKLTLCERVVDDLKAFHDGELSFSHAVVVRIHLARCAACREERNWMQTLTEEIKTEEPADVKMSDELRAKILENAPQPSVAPVELPVAKRSSKQVSKGQLALLGGVLAAGLCFFVVTDNYSSSSSEVAFDPAPSTQNHSNSPGRSVFEPEHGTYFRNELKKSKETITLRAGSSASDTFANSEFFSARQVHKEGRLTVAVSDVEARSFAVESLVKSSGGFLASNTLSTGANDLKTASLDVRVPVGKFENVVGQISKLGEVREKSVSGQDITENYAATQARRQTLAQELSIQEARLREKEKNAKKRDQNSLWMLRSEVRQLRLQAAEARARFEATKKLADLATLSVTLQQKAAPVKAAGFTDSLGSTGRDAWSSFSVAAKLPLQLLIWILAYSPLWIPALFIWKKWGRKMLS